MQHDEIRQRSRWIIRAMEWDDTKARYPNIWNEGMPRNLLAMVRVAGRLRLGDLIVSYYPASQRHPERSDRYLGISRVSGLRRAAREDFAWIDLETAFRFDPPLKLEQAPRRVFLCCDSGWPEPEVELFQAVFDAAVAAGWQPEHEEAEPAAARGPARAETVPAAAAGPQASPAAEPPAPPADLGEPSRTFAGVDYSGDMRDPRDGTWLAVLGLHGDDLWVKRLEATGRSGLESYLRDPDRSLMSAEAIGLDFPFALPVSFAESLLGGKFPEEGWWALVKRLEKLTRPGFLSAVQEFREANGEIKRWTDEAAHAPSPLNREQRDLSPMSFHGIRMIGEDRSRYAVRPFESAQARLLLEVHPEGTLRQLGLADARSARELQKASLPKLAGAGHLPVKMEGRFAKLCREQRGALFAVLAARCTAAAVLSGEADKTPEALAPDNAEQVRREGWIYGLQEVTPEAAMSDDGSVEPETAS